jgi:hypothetical protein
MLFLYRETTMNTQPEIIEAKVLKLPPSDRSHLLERPVASLDIDSEVEAAWLREADRREAELDSGEATEVPGAEAIKRLRARLAK